jgi:hypothetical protein
VELGIAEIAALITILAATIYIMGMFALVYPIYRDVAKNSPTTLYVVSLVPRTVVAGHGVRLLVGIPLIWAILFAASLSVPMLMYEGVNASIREAGSIPSKVVSAVVHELPVVASVAIVLFLLGLHEVMRAAGLYDILYPSYSRRLTQKWFAVNNFSLSLIAANFLGCAGGALGGFILATSILVTRGVTWEAVIIPLAVLIFTVVVANLLLVMSIKPLMPRVTATVVDGANTDGPDGGANGTSKGDEVTGFLLAHSDGYWYIFEDTSPNPAVNAVPDNRAQTVILRQTDVI